MILGIGLAVIIVGGIIYAIIEGKQNKDLEPAVMPTVDIKNISEKEIVVTFSVVTKPEVKLGKYKDLKIEKEKIEVTEEEIEHELGHLKEQFIEIKAKEDGVVEEGNEVRIDCKVE